MPDLHLRANALSLSRGGRPVLSELSFSVASGAALVLRGPNGAGKSSALMVLAGLLKPDAGTLEVEGREPDAPPLAHLHYVGHAAGIKPGLSLQDNLAFWADMLGGDRGLIGSALSAAGLGGLEALDAGLLSAGQVRRLALARLLVARRPLWLLDEPTTALDAQGAQWVETLVSDHLAWGGCAVIATHLDLALRGPAQTLTLPRGAA